ncbi:uncharacterized protein C21orf58 [Centropristis striata]|uniref:uncharacterized protein C21orf58 n=1 Tax=Centropristis striata TaxID=184440 RepID=UPI0027DEB9AB|nr:uncharacterized protein C21orf58 [Centropristis striata]
MPMFQHGSSMVDQMTRLRLKLLEKRLENKKHDMDDRAESAQSTRSFDGQLDQLHRALRRKQELLQRLREQHMLEDLSRPQTWGGSQRRYRSHFFSEPPPVQLHHQAAAAAPSFLLHPPPAPPQPPRIIQQTLPQQPATIIQQLPQQQPLITQIPPPQPQPAARSGSIKEDMVELMLMQNAQMHQIIMHNMMLKALPPGGSSHFTPQTTYHGQDGYQGQPLFVRPDVKARGSAVHHHHHYGPTAAAPQLPPISLPTWLPGGSSLPAGAAGGPPLSFHHAAPYTLPPLNV